jgi:hypothetical protein
VTLCQAKRGLQQVAPVVQHGREQVAAYQGGIEPFRAQFRFRRQGLLAQLKCCGKEDVFWRGLCSLLMNFVELVCVRFSPTYAKEDEKMPILKNIPLSRRVFVLLCMLFAMMATTLVLPEDAWAAAKRPKWVSTKVVKWQVQKSKTIPYNKPGHVILSVEIQHKNNSTDKVITRIYDKLLSITLNDSSGSQAAIKSNKVNKVSVEPGQTCTLRYPMPVMLQKKGSNWSVVNKNLLGNAKSLKMNNLYYDFAVKAEGI